MGLPYNTPAFAPIDVYSEDPELEAEMLGFDPAAFPATDPFIAEIEAQAAAEAAAQVAPPVIAAPVPPPDPNPAPVVEPTPEPADEFVPDIDGVANAVANASQEQTTFDPNGIPQAGVMGMGGGLPPEYEPTDGFAPMYGSLDTDLELQALTDERAGDTLIEPELAGEFAVDSVPAQDLTDEALSIRAFEFQQAQQADKERALLEEQDQDAKRKLRNAQVYEERLADADKKSAAVFQRAEELAREKLDKDRYVNGMSWGQKAAGLFSILAGGQLGLISGRGGNDALDFFMGEINRDIEEQKFNIENDKANLANQKGLVADLYRETGNAYEAAETARLAMFEASIAEIDNQMARKDPYGQQAIELEMQKRKLRAAADQQKAMVQAQQKKAAMADAKFKIDAYDKQSQIDKRLAEMGKIQAETAKLNRRSAGTGSQKQSPDYYEALYGKDGRPPVPMSAKEHSAWLSTRGKVAKLNPGSDPKATADLTKAESEAKLASLEANSGPGGNPFAIGDHNGSPLENKGGKIFAVPDPTQRKKLSSMYSAALNIRRIADLAKILRKKGGGASKMVGSKEYQELIGLAAATDFETYKAFDLGAPSAGDAQMAADARGGKDITSWVYDASHGLEAYAQNVENKLDAHYRIEGGYTGKKLRMPRKSPGKDKERGSAMVEKDLLAPRLKTDTDDTEYLKDKRRDLSVWLKSKPSKKDMDRLAQSFSDKVVRGEWERTDVENLLIQMAPHYTQKSNSDWGNVLRKTKDPGEFGDKRMPDPGEFYRHLMEQK